MTPKAAALLAELRRRRLIGSLHDWCAYCLESIGQKPQVHHKLLIEKLEAVERGEIKRLMVMMPPGSAKTTYSSVLFPPWFLARQAGRTAILASHTADLAEANSGKVIRTIGEFGGAIGLQTLSQGVKYWRTNNRNEVKSAGVGGPITGRRADLALIDDPVKSREDAESETYREKAWSWFWSDLHTRLKPGAATVLIMTRWHEDDLAGRLLQTSGDDWHVVSLPAEAEDNDPLSRKFGEFLWSGDPGYDYGSLLRETKRTLERNGAMRDWWSLYQQRPRPAEGALFKTAFIGGIASPVPGQSIRAWDLAATAKIGTRDPDWTVGARMTKTPDGKFIIDDIVRLRGSPDEVESAIVATAARDGRSVGIRLPQDPGQAGKPIWEREMILMADGTTRELCAVSVGDCVIGHDGVPHPVSAVFDQGDLPTIKITTESGREIVAALDHPFLTPDGWVNAGKLKIGETLALRSKPKIIAGSVRTNEEFRLAGYFVGDGSVGRASKAGKNGSCHAEFTCADSDQLADFIACVHSIGGVVVQRKRDVQVGTKGIQGWLRESKVAGHTAYTKHIPSWVFEAEPEKIAHFLGAYFACDGTISKAGDEIVYYSVSRRLLEEVQHLLLRVGISSTLKRKNGKYLETRHESWLLRLRQQDDAYGRFVRRVPFFHGAKTKRMQEILGGTRFRRFDEEFLPDRISSVEDAGIRRCRCLTVNDAHTFLVRDVVVHNSQVLYLTRKLAGYNVTSQPVSGDKSTRAAPFASQVNIGNVATVQAQWNRALIDEMAAFPSGAHDDQVDALSDAFAGLIAPSITTVKRLGY